MNRLSSIILGFLLLCLYSCNKPVAKSNDSKALKKIPKEERIQIFVENAFADEMAITLNGNEVLVLEPFGSDSIVTSAGEIKLDAIVNEKNVDSLSQNILKDENNKKVTANFLFSPGAKYDYEIIKARYAYIVGGGISSVGKINDKNWISEPFDYYPSQALPNVVQSETTRTKIYRTIESDTPAEIACHFLENPQSKFYWSRSILAAPAAAAKLDDKVKAEEILFSCFSKKIEEKGFYLALAQALVPIVSENRVPEMEKLILDHQVNREIRKSMLLLLAGKGHSEAVLKAFEAKLLYIHDLTSAFKYTSDSMRQKMLMSILDSIKAPVKRELSKLIKLEDFNDDNFFQKVLASTSNDSKSKLGDNISQMFRNAYLKKTLPESLFEKMVSFIVSQDNRDNELFVIKTFLDNEKFDKVKPLIPSLNPYTIDRLFDLLRESKYRQKGYSKKLSLWTLDSPEPRVQKEAVSAFRSSKNWLDVDFKKKIEAIAAKEELTDYEKELIIYYFHIQLDELKPYSKYRAKILEWMPIMLDSTVDKVISHMVERNENEQNNLNDLLQVYPKLRDKRCKEKVLRNMCRFRKAKDLTYEFLAGQMNETENEELSLIAFETLTAYLNNEEKAYIAKYREQILERVQSERNPEKKKAMKINYAKWWLKSISRHYKENTKAGEDAINFIKEYNEDKEIARLAAEAVIDCCSHQQIMSLLDEILTYNESAQKVFANSHYNVFRKNKETPGKFKFYSTLLNSSDPKVRQDTFRNFNFAINRKEVDQAQSIAVLKKAIVAEKDEETKKFMESTYYREKLRTLRNEITKDPAKAQIAIKYIENFPQNEDIVGDAILCLLRAKSIEMVPCLLKNFDKFSAKSLEKVCNNLYSNLRKGDSNLIPFYTKALTSENKSTRIQAFERMASSYHAKNPLNEKLKILLQKALEAEQEDIIKRRMTYAMQRLK